MRAETEVADNGYILIPGVIYNAIPTYSDSGELDELARFFYDKVLPVERRLSHLRGIFGLPDRVVEGILVDLVRRNYAFLDLTRGNRQIVPIDDPTPRLNLKEEQAADFWQDGTTGTVVRLSNIPSKYFGGRDGSTLSLAPEPTVSSFVDMPSARIVGMLRITSPNFATLGSGHRLESLHGRHRIATSDLRVPVQPYVVDGVPVMHVDAPEFPYWLARSWSRKANEERFQETRYVQSLVASIERTSRPPASVLDRCSLATLIRAWHQTVINLSRHNTARGIRDRKAAYEAARDALVERLDGIVETGLVEAGEQAVSHLLEMRQEASRFLMICSDSTAADAERSALAEALGPEADWVVPLVLAESLPAGSTKHFKSPLDAPPDLLRRLELPVSVPQGGCVVDGIELRLGSLEMLLSGRAVLRLRGRSTVQDLVSNASELFARDFDTSFYTESLLRPIVGSSEGRPGGEAEPRKPGDLPSEHADPDLLRSLIETIDDTVLGALDQVRSLWEEYDLTRGGDRDEAVGAPPSLTEIASELVELESQLLWWSSAHRLPPPLATVHIEPIADAVTTATDVFAALAMDEKQHSVLVTLDLIAEPDQCKQMVEILGRLLKAQNDLTLYLNPETSAGSSHDPAALKTLIRWSKALEHPRLVLKRGTHKLPVALVVDAEYVVLGGGTWFSPPPHLHWVFAMQAPHVARQLLEASKEARVLNPR